MSRSRFTVDTNAGQQVFPEGARERFEGVAFSSSGTVLALATADTNSVSMYKCSNGVIEKKPFCKFGDLDYPHDVSFATVGNFALLAVAQRVGAIAIYRCNGSAEGTFERVWDIEGADTKLAHSDGVAFVPPHNEYLAACNLTSNTISFYRRVSVNPFQFTSAPDFELRHSSMVHPDGLAFSNCGTWLAVANHAGGSVSIFKRGGRFHSNAVYGPDPVTVITDPELRHPHSVAFTPQKSNLVVTNAGANFVSAYEREGIFWKRWKQEPIVRMRVLDEGAFDAVNSENNMEGGPKGIAIHNNRMAVCSPEIGLKIYSFSEG